MLRMLLSFDFKSSHGKTSVKTCKGVTAMPKTKVTCEMLGGVLDGKRFDLPMENAGEEVLRLKNPSPVTFNSQLCAPLVLGKVLYRRSHMRNFVLY